MKFYVLSQKQQVFAISPIFIFVFLFLLASCPLMGQWGPKKAIVQPKDFNKWHTLRAPLISGDGKWISYWLDYKQGQDTLCLMDNKGTIIHQLPDSHSGQFSTAKHPSVFAFKHNTKGVGIVHLNSGKLEWIAAQRFVFSDDGNYLACYSPNSENGDLKLFNIDGNSTFSFTGVKDVLFNPTNDYAAIIKKDAHKSSIEILDLSNMNSAAILSNNTSDYLFPTWNRGGTALAFIEKTDQGKQRLFYFENGENAMLKDIDGFDLNAGQNMEISKRKLTFSDDGKRLFFSMHAPTKHSLNKNADSVKVQLWKGSDKMLYSQQQLDWDFNNMDRLAIWWPQTKKIIQIETENRPQSLLTADQKFAISYNPLTYEPQFKEYPPADYYITNLETGEVQLFAKKLSTVLDAYSMSPDGKYIAYTKDGQWWTYDVEKQQHKEMPENLGLGSTYGKMGWTHSNEFLIYDEWDILKLNPNGSPPVRLTNGRPNKVSYREYKGLYQGFFPIGKREKFLGFNLDKNLVLSSTDSLFNHGFALLKPNSKIDHFLDLTGRISELRKAKFVNSYIFVVEKNDSPPALYLLKGNNSKMLFQSNSQQERFKLGKTEMISFKNKQGEKLHGLLHYPDNYESGKQYPMIVHVYEIAAPRFQYFTNPDLFSDIGFNYRNFTAQGYFVLEPDLKIQKGNPGISATDCTIAAVNKVMDLGMVRKDGIGLLGHSFGGYEAAFIITQTGVFSAAVIGAGVFDIVSSYHSIAKNTGMTEFESYEHNQWQMGKSFYEDRQGYKNNSPLEFAQNIQTPTLIWTGNQDYHVNWHQSEAMYLALRRLGLDVQMLIYEEESHSLMEPKNQKDLTTRIEEWFNNNLNH
ncbi:MAG: S9 family peptidase [Flavobacteriaceae bacterium]|nr:S9 family peptidase [Flavobacteriaceae bacterium]